MAAAACEDVRADLEYDRAARVTWNQEGNCPGGPLMDKNALGEDVIFYESTAAARSLKNTWTRMASTKKLMNVVWS